MIDYIRYADIDKTKEVYDTLFIKSYFTISNLADSSRITKNSSMLTDTFNAIKESYRILRTGGLLFVYGIPKHLPYYADFLNNLVTKHDKYLFKYWISVEFNQMHVSQPLPSAHVGLLMYLKTQKGRNITPFKLNTKEYRIPHSTCKACGNNLKDWGGKSILSTPLALHSLMCGKT